MPILPTLEKMAGVYRLSREGGPTSPRFTEYVRAARDAWALPLYNPMAGPAALETVELLVAMGAEELASLELEKMQQLLNEREPLTLAIVVASKGMWTDRLGTEAEYRTKEDRDRARGIIYLWSREEIAERDVQREAAAEAIRVIWTIRNGQAISLYAVLAREGLAYAASLNPHAERTDSNERASEAISILGNSVNHGEIVATLYGDDAAKDLGFAPLGLGERAGYRWATNHMDEIVRQRGAVEALRYSLELSV